MTSLNRRCCSPALPGTLAFSHWEMILKSRRSPGLPRYLEKCCQKFSGKSILSFHGLFVSDSHHGRFGIQRLPLSPRLGPPGTPPLYSGGHRPPPFLGSHWRLDDAESRRAMGQPRMSSSPQSSWADGGAREGRVARR